MGDGVTFLPSRCKQDTEITGPIAAKLWVSSATEDADLFLVVRVFTPGHEGGRVPAARSIRTRRSRRAGCGCSHRKLDTALTLPYRPYHTHDEMQKLTPGEVVRGATSRSGRPASWCRRGYRLALTVRGKDYVYGGDVAPSEHKTAKPWTGVALFRHDDPADRPVSVFGGDVTLHAGPSGSLSCCCP